VRRHRVGTAARHLLLWMLGRFISLGPFRIRLKYPLLRRHKPAFPLSAVQHQIMDAGPLFLYASGVLMAVLAAPWSPQVLIP